MQIFQWLQAQMLFLEIKLPFLQAEWFTVLYGLVVFLNPLAIAPQLISSIRSKPEELRGVAISMFVIFLTIQSAVALGAIKSSDISLFGSMAISAVITLAVIIVTVVRRK
jgi:uncharacterized protein with PQ loop repeat